MCGPVAAPDEIRLTLPDNVGPEMPPPSVLRLLSAVLPAPKSSKLITCVEAAEALPLQAPMLMRAVRAQ